MAQEKITATQLLLPVSLISFILMIFLGFQTMLLVGDHDSLKLAHQAQVQQLEQVTKLKDQTNALALGTLKLAKGGDKGAQNIIDSLKKAGINVQDETPAAPAPVPAP